MLSLHNGSMDEKSSSYQHRYTAPKSWVVDPGLLEKERLRRSFSKSSESKYSRYQWAKARSCRHSHRLCIAFIHEHAHHMNHRGRLDHHAHFQLCSGCSSTTFHPTSPTQFQPSTTFTQTGSSSGCGSFIAARRNSRTGRTCHLWCLFDPWNGPSNHPR